MFDKLENIVRSRYTTMYNRYGKGFNCPKITLVIDVNYSAESACHASDKTIYINPNWFVDHPDDCDALLHAGWCGVELLATAHAGSISDLKNRLIYRPLIDKRLFTTVIILHRDKSWAVERIAL